jgi:dienelactone hydrolase
MCLALLWLPASSRAAAGNAVHERITIPIDGGTLNARLFRPQGAGPFPAVVALHGCSGPFNQRGELSARHLDWAERLAGEGFIVLLPDSFGSRGLGAQCLVRDRLVRPSRERVGDARAARAYLQSRGDVDARRVSLLGWSNGGSTTLWAVGKRSEPADGQPDFQAAIAFYPGCRTVLEKASKGEWVSRVPLLILIGEADSWTPVAPCRELVALAQREGQRIRIVTYPNAVHDFDHPSLPIRRRGNLAFTADNSGEALVGTEPAARADAIVRVSDFLRQ